MTYVLQTCATITPSHSNFVCKPLPLPCLALELSFLRPFSHHTNLHPRANRRFRQPSQDTLPPSSSIPFLQRLAETCMPLIDSQDMTKTKKESIFSYFSLSVRSSSLSAHGVDHLLLTPNYSCPCPLPRTASQPLLNRRGGTEPSPRFYNQASSTYKLISTLPI